VVKWKLFNRSEKKIQTETERTSEHRQETEETPLIEEIKEESEKLPTKEYNETLYSKGSGQKQPASISEKKQPLKRTSWENSETIEINVDKMGRKQIVALKNRVKTRDDTDQKVDRILLKKKGRL
jgi:hypothetical protein